MLDLRQPFDVIVVGGGHAGVESAIASAKTGALTLLLTHNSATLGELSCNPSIGGIGKGHLVKEIDALGGLMGKAADFSGIHFRRLNASKGPAVRATRAQIDRERYKSFIRTHVENQENLIYFQDAVDNILIEKDQVKGVITKTGLHLKAKSVVLTVGTFLNGKIHIGEVNFSAGRMGDPASILLADRLKAFGFPMLRLKTGTPARIDARSVDFSHLKIQSGEIPIPHFSFCDETMDYPKQVDCHIAVTNEKTHEIIRSALDRSPLYQGVIEGIGPRYCPSIEDKIVRFKDRSSHQIFIEPEGLNTQELYPNGISTSLPVDVQVDFIRSMVGFEKAHLTRPGYAIEYDFCDPRALKVTLETKKIEHLFFAGQINGTTGYEEAAAQGLIAGLNAARKAMGKTEWSPKRSEAYIGVMIDDLITKGTKEPYRMFTSRAEYRLLLREDNADLRLTSKGYELGLVDEKRLQSFETKRAMIEKRAQDLKTTFIHPKTKEAAKVEAITGQKLMREYALIDLLKRPNVTYADLMQSMDLDDDLDINVAEQLEIQAKYAGYIDRQLLDIDRHQRYESLLISRDFNYETVKGLSSEVLQKLKDQRPETVGEASRIPGVTPAAISLLLVYLKRGQK